VPLTEESRKVADALVTQVRGELTRALESSGPLRAVVVCKYSMPEISSNLSRKHGWRISRVSLKARNPALGMPDAWEQRVLQHFDQQVSRGEKAASLEHGEVVSEPAGKYFRYMRALAMGPLCQACHGTPDQISEAIRAQLALEYPSDIGDRLPPRAGSRGGHHQTPGGLSRRAATAFLGLGQAGCQACIRVGSIQPHRGGYPPFVGPSRRPEAVSAARERPWPANGRRRPPDGSISWLPARCGSRRCRP
jgi:hypothetical protein